MEQMYYPFGEINHILPAVCMIFIINNIQCSRIYFQRAIKIHENGFFSVFFFKLNPQFMRGRRVSRNFEACSTPLLLIVNLLMTGADLLAALFCSRCFVYGAEPNPNGSGGDETRRRRGGETLAVSRAAALTFRQVSGSHGQMSGNNAELDPADCPFGSRRRGADLNICWALLCRRGSYLRRYSDICRDARLRFSSGELVLPSGSFLPSACNARLSFHS